MALAEANQKFFDSLTDTYDDETPWRVKAITQITDAVREHLGWIGVNWAKPELDAGIEEAEKVRLLDYACGTGLISRALGPHVTTTTGIDVSPNMVSAFNKRATDAGIPRSQVSAVVGNLFTPEPSDALAEPEYFNFDIVAVGSAYHHFEDVTLATKRLVERLKPGGVLFIIDFSQGTGVDHSHGHGHHGHVHHGPNNHHGHGHAHHAHHGCSHANVPEDVSKDLPKEMIDSIKVTGFDEARVRALFEEAGLVEFAISVLDEKLYMEYSGKGMERTVFFARGTRPVAQDV